MHKYKEILQLGDDVAFIKIEHDDAMVTTVYQIIQPNTAPLILKVCDSPLHAQNEVYFLNYFAEHISVPKVMGMVQACKEMRSAVLMEYVPGNVLTRSGITKEIAFLIGTSLAKIHAHKTSGFGYLNRAQGLNSNPMVHFKEKFEEGIAECTGHLPESTIIKSMDYFNKALHLLEKVDGPCIIHRDFRPGNMIIDQNTLSGIIDWSSARASFAEDDFCAIEHNEWGDFKGYKRVFLDGYSRIRPIPNYHAIMPLLRLNRAIAVIGFTVKKRTWDNIHERIYTVNRQYIDIFDFVYTQPTP
jgi:Ser/Thr protein kinase RdoA (MazF antagonist)